MSDLVGDVGQNLVVSCGVKQDGSLGNREVVINQAGYLYRLARKLRRRKTREVGCPYGRVAKHARTAKRVGGNDFAIFVDDDLDLHHSFSAHSTSNVRIRRR